jgi:hypothetical protein
MTGTTSRFRWIAGVALAAGTMMVGGWTSVVPTATGAQPPLAVAVATSDTTVAPPRHDARHVSRTAHHRVARRDVTVTKETTDTETTTIVPAAPVATPVTVAPATTTTRSVTETTTTR